MAEALHEQAFRQAVLDPDTRTPAGLASAFGGTPVKRFDVYRNNVTVSLIEALGDIFPAVKRIVGEDRFADLARLFVRAHPPTSPLLFRYGYAFPAFIEAFEPAASMPYLADVARLERAWLDAYHAADADPLEPEALAAVAPEKLPEARFAPHPAAALVRSPFAAVTIFNANRGGEPSGRINAAIAENGLIARPAYEVTIISIDAATAAFVDALMKGSTLADAAQTAAEANDTFDLSAAIGLVLQTGIFTAIDI